MKRALAWIISAAVLVFVALFVTHLYLTIPSGEATPVLAWALLAAVFVAVAFIAGVYIHDAIQDRHYRDDADEWTGPLQTPAPTEATLTTDLRQRRMLLRPRGLSEHKATLLAAKVYRRTLRRRGLRQMERPDAPVEPAAAPEPSPKRGKHAAPKGQQALPRPAVTITEAPLPVIPYAPPLPPEAVAVALIPTRVTASPLAPFFPVPSRPPLPEVTVERLGAPSVPEGDDVTDLLPIGQFDEPEPPEEPPAPVSEAPRPRPQDRPFTDWLRDSVVMEAIKDGAPS